MSCRPGSQHPAPGLATRSRHLLGPPPRPPPRPRGRGLEKHRALPRPPPSPARSGPQAPQDPPSQSLDTVRATPEQGRLSVKIMLTTDVRNDQLSPLPLAKVLRGGERPGARGSWAPRFRLLLVSKGHVLRRQTRGRPARLALSPHCQPLPGPRGHHDQGEGDVRRGTRVTVPGSGTRPAARPSEAPAGLARGHG